ncbi:MAG: hypothetical protein RLZZ324_909 [Candidatus Parcubacteria bacterium]
MVAPQTLVTALIWCVGFVMVAYVHQYFRYRQGTYFWWAMERTFKGYSNAKPPSVSGYFRFLREHAFAAGMYTAFLIVTMIIIVLYYHCIVYLS